MHIHKNHKKCESSILSYFQTSNVLFTKPSCLCRILNPNTWDNTVLYWQPFDKTLNKKRQIIESQYAINSDNFWTWSAWLSMYKKTSKREWPISSAHNHRANLKLRLFTGWTSCHPISKHCKLDQFSTVFRSVIFEKKGISSSAPKCLILVHSS